MKRRKGTSPFFISLSEFWLCVAFAAMGVMGTQLHAEQEERTRQIQASRSNAKTAELRPTTITLGATSIEIDGSPINKVSDLRTRARGPIVIRVGDEVPAGRLKEVLGNLSAATAVSVATHSN